VVGAVLNPGALQFEPGKKVEEYVGESGGLQNSADDNRVFVVYPNGVAEPVNISRWAFSSISVPPGSTIVVPKDTSPLKIAFVRDIATIISQLALSAASIAVISR
jgi:protein involved in polysaccharide export with SLBB domain